MMRHKPIYRLSILAILLGLLLLAEHAGLFSGIDNYFYDLSFRFRGESKPSDRIVIVAVDETCLKTHGRWPLSRAHYARLIDRLTLSDVIAFDIILSEPTGEDILLSDAIGRHGRVVLPVLINSALAVEGPAQSLGSPKIGHIHIESGIDGIVREIYHTLYYRNLLLPSLSSVVYETVSGATFQRRHYPRDVLSAGGIVQSDRMIINYAGGPGAFQRLSLADVLGGKYPESFFRNKIVLVGVTAEGLSDRTMIPFSQQRRGIAGVEVQANILDNLLAGNAITIPPLWMRWTAAVILALLLFFVFSRVSEKRGLLIAAGLLVGIATLTFILFYRLHIWSKPALYTLATAGIFVLTYTFRFDDAIERLDKAYENILPHLRWKGPAAGKTVLHGVSGIFTPNGIQSKMAVLTEVTNQLIFEKELADRAILSNVQGVALFGPDGKNIILNEHARMFCEDNSVPAETAELFARGIAPYSMEEGDISKALSSAREGAADMSFILSLPLPAKKFYKVDASPLQAGNDRYLLVVLSDITKLKELEILKGQMISVVSHELRTPMTSVQGFSELLILGLEGKMKDYAVIIHEEAKRLTKFINAFLDITRMEDGKLPINRVPVSIPDLVREAATSVSPLARQRGVPVTVDCPEKTNTIMIDRDLTKQCVINLAENALKYSKPGKDVIIRVRDEDKSLRIDVIDHGCGISQEDIGRVFEKFYRVRNEGTESIKGFGLGLIFVKDAVEAQGGRVTVESVYGEGSTFSIVFPVGN